MAPSRTPRRAKEERDYGNVGVKGRKTGITLKDSGVRDEHGLEPLDGIFSSPEKPTTKQNGVMQYSTIIEDDSMDIGSSTIPEPTEMLKGPRTAKTMLPPRSRSPIKTHLGSSPRRSVGPVSSPSRFFNQTPTRASSHPPNETMIGTSNEDVTPSVEASEVEGRSSQLKRVKKAKLNGRGVKRPFNLSLDEDDDETAPSESPIPMAPPTLPNDFDDSTTSQPLPRTKPARGRPPKLPKPGNHVNGVDGSGVEPPQVMEEESQVEMEHDVVDLEREVEQEAGQEAGQNEEQVAGDDDDKDPAQESEQAQPMAKKRRGRKTPVSRKDTNTTMKPPPKPKANSTQHKLKSVSKQPNKPNARSLYVSRSETPAQDSGARTTRAGRNVLKPVAFWRGERIVYGDGVIEGSTLTLPGIKEVIRTEEVAVPRPKRSSYRRPKPTSRVQEAQEVEEEEEEREAWETDTGIIRAQVLQWDSINGRYDEENTEEAEVAYAAEAIEMRDIGGSDFRFAKTLTLPFFGSGMVDLPPGGAKRVKNSRKMQLIFFVYYGRVTVDVGTPTTSFSIGKGGMWQVPRGNFYSIANHSETKSARIFFAQGCEVAPGMSFDDSQAA